jgi:hypothetical protein
LELGEIVVCGGVKPEPQPTDAATNRIPTNKQTVACEFLTYAPFVFETPRTTAPCYLQSKGEGIIYKFMSTDKRLVAGSR